MTRDELIDVLTRVAQRAHDIGIRPVETFFSLERDQVIELFEAGTEAQVREAFVGAGLPTPDVFPGDRVHTGLLDEPRRAR